MKSQKLYGKNNFLLWLGYGYAGGSGGTEFGRKPHWLHWFIYIKSLIEIMKKDVKH